MLANTLNTFAVDPELRVGYAQNWQASLQRDLPMSLTVNATYLGSKGSNLMQAFVPNTYPIGAVNPCPACPTGFRYLISDGRSIRNAAQVQLRRRLRNGFTSSVQYTIATAMDNAGSFGGRHHRRAGAGAELARPRGGIRALQLRPAPPGGRDVRIHHRRRRPRRHAPRRHEGPPAQGLDVHQPGDDGQRTAADADLFLAVGATGIIGASRPSLTGTSPEPTADGTYANPAAFTAPAAGEWGNASRNSITGPSQFSMNASVARTFRIGERINMDWRIDATNVLNRVTFAGVNNADHQPAIRAAEPDQRHAEAAHQLPIQVLRQLEPR